MIREKERATKRKGKQKKASTVPINKREGQIR